MKFTINGKEYEGAKYNYNTSCAFEEMGVSIADFAKKPQSIMRAYLAISGKIELEEAGDEIEQHVINGGDLNGITEVLAKEMQESGFFKSLQEMAKEESPKRKK